MADVRPFRAVRYASPSADVTAPPYDVLDEPQRVELRARDPHNVVQLTCDPDETAGVSSRTSTPSSSQARKR